MKAMNELLEFTFLTRVEKSIVNANQNEGNLIVLKKTQDIDGPHVYISGTSIKYAIKEIIREYGNPCSPLSEKTADGTISSLGNPIKYYDDDLFGYMITTGSKKTKTQKGNEEKKDSATKIRVAPVKTNGMFSLFPYSGDINIGVRYNADRSDNALFNVELDTNIFRSNWAIELSRIGADQGFEKPLEPNERLKRINALLSSLFELHGGGHQSNYLTNLQPKFLIAVHREGSCPVVLDSLCMDKEKKLDITSLIEALELHANRIKGIWVGTLPDFTSNWLEAETQIQNFAKKYKIPLKIGKMSEIKPHLLDQKWYG